MPKGAKYKKVNRYVLNKYIQICKYLNIDASISVKYIFCIELHKRILWVNV